MFALQCHGLKKEYPGGVVAVGGIDLQVRMGDCFGLLGPNGAGKTSTLEMLEGLSLPSGGTIEILGQPWSTDELGTRDRIGVTLQHTELMPGLSVEETLRMFQGLFEQPRSVDELLGLVGLEERRKKEVFHLSGGQRQRLVIACALVGDPELVFLDEPTVGLDPQSRHRLWDLIQGLRSAGCTTVLTTHYMDEAERLCDRVAVIDHGKIIASGAPRDLVATLGASELIDFVLREEISPTILQSLEGKATFVVRQKRITIAAPNPASLMPLLVERFGPFGIDSVSTRAATLEEVFLRLTGRSLRD